MILTKWWFPSNCVPEILAVRWHSFWYLCCSMTFNLICWLFNDIHYFDILAVRWHSFWYPGCLMTFILMMIYLLGVLAVWWWFIFLMSWLMMIFCFMSWRMMIFLLYVLAVWWFSSLRFWLFVDLSAVRSECLMIFLIDVQTEDSLPLGPSIWCSNQDPENKNCEKKRLQLVGLLLHSFFSDNKKKKFKSHGDASTN